MAPTGDVSSLDSLLSEVRVWLYSSLNLAAVLQVSATKRSSARGSK